MVLYIGILVSLDTDPGEWLVLFDADNETTAVKFLDEDVYLVK